MYYDRSRFKDIMEKESDSFIENRLCMTLVRLGLVKASHFMDHSILRIMQRMEEDC